MNAAESIIAKFGGQSALAKLIERRQSTVQHWAKTGTIPAKWQAPLLALAERQGIGLSASDFMVTSPTPRAEIVISAAPPRAEWQGVLSIGEKGVPCYVLSDGQRVISRAAATAVLTDGKGGGNLESYVEVEALKGYVPDLTDHLVDFTIDQVVNKNVRGLTAEGFLEICRAYVKALTEGVLKSDRQTQIAMKATMFMAACAKTGLIALIDEATGYQYDRAQDALQIKLKLFLEKEMRTEWEKTFPDELWREFGRLTNWKGAIHQRPKYWGKLVLELVYGYLDADVTDWLRKNAPAPRKGQNYHQWLSAQYGLKKLVEHIWLLIGMASACMSMTELRDRMAEKFGKQRVQLTLFLPRPRPGN